MRERLDEHEILHLAAELLRRHELDLPLRWSRARRYLAAVAFDRRSGRALQLRLSRPLLPRLDPDLVRDALLHEIAHVHAGMRAGHGPAWKAAARRVGANPSRTTLLPDEVHEAVSKYRATCRRCGAGVYFQRRPMHPLRSYRHAPRRCGGTLGDFETLR